MIKKLSFYFLSFLLIIFFVLSFDFVLSNTVLKYNHCYKFEEFFYELKKNCKGKYRFKKSFPVKLTITDEMGSRIGKKKIEKDINKKNIFIFGDSFTYGVGIEFEKTYVGLLTENLKYYNIYNFGVGSYSPSVHLYKLKQVLNKNLKPSKIILFLDLTDVIDEANRWNFDEKNETVMLSTNFLYNEFNKKKSFSEKNFKLSKNISSYLNFNLRNLREKSNIRIRDKRKIKTSIQGSFTYTDANNLDQRFWKKNTFKRGLNFIEKRLKQISKVAKKNNSEFYVVIYPWAETLEFGQQKFNWSYFVNSICDNGTCKLIDAIPAFNDYKNKNIDWSTELYFLNDEHFNEKGANLLYKTVLKNINNEN